MFRVVESSSSFLWASFTLERLTIEDRDLEKRTPFLDTEATCACLFVQLYFTSAYIQIKNLDFFVTMFIMFRWHLDESYVKRLQQALSQNPNMPCGNGLGLLRAQVHLCGPQANKLSQKRCLVMINSPLSRASPLPPNLSISLWARHFTPFETIES